MSESTATAQLRLCKATTPKSELAKVIANWHSVTYLQLQINMCLEQSGIIHIIVAYITSDIQIYVFEKHTPSWSAETFMLHLIGNGTG